MMVQAVAAEVSPPEGVFVRTNSWVDVKEEQPPNFLGLTTDLGLEYLCGGVCCAYYDQRPPINVAETVAVEVMEPVSSYYDAPLPEVSRPPLRRSESLPAPQKPPLQSALRSKSYPAGSPLKKSVSFLLPAEGPRRRRSTTSHQQPSHQQPSHHQASHHQASQQQPSPPNSMYSKKYSNKPRGNAPPPPPPKSVHGSPKRKSSRASPRPPLSSSSSSSSSPPLQSGPRSSRKASARLQRSYTK
ncbi:hypothetical protein CTAYLR_009826 [Chrysophaeum taylorii]|uniref:Uncharacterized protein n=1 Tax=Chrysophaeum taylorii TaxID=2483200 RepID=A0AAD7UCX8_9STRA|nr:hypothetical protein CTAYLR_009826 [Chrysophaeum taylorii]